MEVEKLSRNQNGRIGAKGTMADAIRAFDWSRTEVGAIETWEPRLLFAVETVLGCAFPATLQWGEELLLFYNDAYIPLIGDRHPAALGKPILETFPEIVEVYAPLARRVLAGESILLKRQLYRYPRHSGVEDLWFDLSYSPIPGHNGRAAGVLAIGLDTTPAVVAEHARTEAEARLKRVLETDAVGVIFFDYSGTIIEANDVFLTMVGCTRQDIGTGKLTWRTFTPPEWVAVSEQQMKKFEATGRIGPYEKEYILKDGERRWMLFAGRDLGDGTIAEYCIDLSGQKRAEQALLSSEKLATLGRLAATIAHEINNPLEAMTNLLYLIHTSHGVPDEAREHAIAADAELKRIAHITRQSLGFYRESTVPVRVSVGELLDSSIDLLAAKIKTRGAVIEREWSGDLLVRAVSGELRQVFSNLISNALDALEPGGRLRIRAAEHRSAVSSQPRAIRVTFADQGSGIRPELRTRIFDPLFSTKGHLGTGLGLWVTKQIVEKHGGTIQMRSRYGGPHSGTVFSVVIPEPLDPQ